MSCNRYTRGFPEHIGTPATIGGPLPPFVAYQVVQQMVTPCTVLQDPAVTAFRSKRGKELEPDPAAAAKYNDNSLRRFVSGRKIAILPDWGSGKPEHAEQQGH